MEEAEFGVIGERVYGRVEVDDDVDKSLCGSSMYDVNFPLLVARRRLWWGPRLRKSWLLPSQLNRNVS